MQEKPIDISLFVITILLAVFGLIMIFSSSSVVASQPPFNNPYVFFKKQAIWLIISIVGLIVFSKVNYKIILKLAPIFFIFTIILLIIVVLTSFGISTKGATRQIGIGFINFSPSELAKLASVFLLSGYCYINEAEMKTFFKGFVKPVLLSGILCGLVMLQPDLGTTMVILFTIFAILFIGQTRFIYLLGLFLISLAGIYLAVFKVGFRAARFLAFLDPWEYIDSIGWQIVHSLYALGSGGLFGVGLGRSHQKYFWLPEQYTDFVFAIIGEELGLIATVAICIAFIYILLKGVQIALKVQDKFASYLALGLTSMITFQAFLNIAVVTSSIPVTGIPLPFLSYGGTSLFVNMIAMGIVLNISRYATKGTRVPC